MRNATDVALAAAAWRLPGVGSSSGISKVRRVSRSAEERRNCSPTAPDVRAVKDAMGVKAVKKRGDGNAVNDPRFAALCRALPARRPAAACLEWLQPDWLSASNSILCCYPPGLYTPALGRRHSRRQGPTVIEWYINSPPPDDEASHSSTAPTSRALTRYSPHHHHTDSAMSDDSSRPAKRTRQACEGCRYARPIPIRPRTGCLLTPVQAQEDPLSR